MRARPALITALVALIALVPSGVSFGQFRKGLTRRTDEAVLNRRRPPRVVLTGTAIKVEVVSQVSGSESLAQRFATTLETQLFANDSRLHAEAVRPDTIVFCTISRLDTSQTAGHRQVAVSKRVGTKRVYNAKKKAYEDEPDYQMVNETQSFTTVRGDLAVAIQVRDRKSGATIDSQTFTPSFSTETPAGTTPPDSSQVEQGLIERAVNAAVQRLTPTREAVRVLLSQPNDQIDSLNRLGQAGLWARMLEQLELTKPLTDPKREAYRQYNLGVANEALAYGTDSLETSIKLLEQASSFYGKALEMNPDEKYFREPQVRIADGIAAYAELDRQRAIIAAAEAKAKADETTAAGQPAEGARSIEAAGTKAARFANRDIIDLVAAGLDEANLLAAIKAADEPDFNLSPVGLKQLLGAKVSNRVISAMRVKQNAPPKAAAAGRRAASRTTRSAPASPASTQPASGQPPPAKPSPAKPM